MRGKKSKEDAEKETADKKEKLSKLMGNPVAVQSALKEYVVPAYYTWKYGVGIQLINGTLRLAKRCAIGAVDIGDETSRVMTWLLKEIDISKPLLASMIANLFTSKALIKYAPQPPIASTDLSYYTTCLGSLAGAGLWGDYMTSTTANLENTGSKMYAFVRKGDVPKGEEEIAQHGSVLMRMVGALSIIRGMLALIEDIGDTYGVKGRTDTKTKESYVDTLNDAINKATENVKHADWATTMAKLAKTKEETIQATNKFMSMGDLKKIKRFSKHSGAERAKVRQASMSTTEMLAYMLASVKTSTVAIIIEFILYLVIGNTTPPRYLSMAEGGKNYITSTEIDKAISYNQAITDMKYRLPNEIWGFMTVG